MASKKGRKLSEETRRRMSAAHTGRKRPEITVPLVDRLARWCNKDGPVHETLGTKCWIWIGAKFKGSGYGQIQFNGKPLRVHRVSWELENGPIPEGVLILHKCDNRTCIRPDHLFPGSHQDNVDDMIAKGRKRVSSGEKHSARIKQVAARGDNHWTRRRMNRGS